MTRAPSSLACAGCGWVPPPDDPYPFRCVAAGSGDDVDHVLVRRLDGSQVSWPREDTANPFVRYRTLLHSYRVASAGGMSDAGFADLAERMDKEVAAVDGRGFAATPFARADELSDRLGFDRDGGVWVKDETGNVSGSHKGRHLMGLLLYLRALEETGRVGGALPDLAIASCGNAALAAAVVARAGDRRLRVFVPPSADAEIVRRLRSLGAVIEVCERRPGVAGDPTYHALRVAIDGGALPFTCQGSENGLAIEGGETLGYEMVSELGRTAGSIDRVVIQVGGGALASAVMAAFTEAVTMGAVDRLPRFVTVQTKGGYPLKRAYDRVKARIMHRLVGDLQMAPASAADAMRRSFADDIVQEELAYAARHRSEFMWPWEEQPKSVAHGILDDETYDWLAIVRDMIATGGTPVVVGEETLLRANDLAREATGIDVDHTGSSGLAGLTQLRDRGDVGPGERVAVLFTGVRRQEGGAR